MSRRFRQLSVSRRLADGWKRLRDAKNEALASGA
jgi:hypothetical protein